MLPDLQYARYRQIYLPTHPFSSRNLRHGPFPSPTISYNVFFTVSLDALRHSFVRMSLVLSESRWSSEDKLKNRLLHLNSERLVSVSIETSAYWTPSPQRDLAFGIFGDKVKTEVAMSLNLKQSSCEFCQAQRSRAMLEEKAQTEVCSNLKVALNKKEMFHSELGGCMFQVFVPSCLGEANSAQSRNVSPHRNHEASSLSEADCSGLHSSWRSTSAHHTGAPKPDILEIAILNW